MQTAATSSAVRVPCASARVSSSRASLGNVAGLTPVFRSRSTRTAVVVRAEGKQQVGRWANHWNQHSYAIRPDVQWHLGALRATADCKQSNVHGSGAKRASE